MNKKIKHLEMIQNVIDRMARCSFSLKGWAVAIAAGLIALEFDMADSIIYYIGTCIPFVFLWALDAYYLRQERLYRALHSDVRKREKTEIDFDMNANKDEYKTCKNCYFRVLFSLTEALFYIPLMAIIVVFEIMK